MPIKHSGCSFIVGKNFRKINLLKSAQKAAYENISCGSHMFPPAVL